MVLQVVLERGEAGFLHTLLDHADQRALTDDTCSCVELATKLSLPRLYKPDRCQRRDLAASGDGFRLLHEMRGKVLKVAGRPSRADGDAQEPSRDPDQDWWDCITDFMRYFVDGYNFDKSPRRHRRELQRQQQLQLENVGSSSKVGPLGRAVSCWGVVLGCRAGVSCWGVV